MFSKSDQSEEVVEDVTEVEGEFSYDYGHQMPNGMYTFFAFGEDAPYDIMEEYPDMSMFYLMAGHEKNDGEAVLLKVTRSIMGWAISPMGSMPKTYMGLAPVKTEARYALPPLPRVIVEKVDNFFRKVAKDLGTEAIVLLTIDPITKEWGVLVPSQSNTAAHCNYDPQSVVDDKPDHVMIVGSIHSHPGMSAYASGTDHHDQETFDGLHITFGYPQNKSTTEFYAEMQFGARYTLDIGYVFEEVEPALDFPELENWSSRVNKAPPTIKTPGVFHSTHNTKTHSTSTQSTTGACEQKTNKVFRSKMLEHLDERTNRPYGCPNPNDNTIVVHLDGSEEDCPVCHSKIDETALNHHKCWHCHTYYFFGDVKTLDDLVAARLESRLSVSDIDITNKSQQPKLPIMKFVHKTLSGGCYATPLWKPEGVSTNFFR